MVVTQPTKTVVAPAFLDPAAAFRSFARWQHGVTVSPVAQVDQRHALHAYYTANPEHPHGDSTLLYTSTERDAHAGQILTIDRGTGDERVLVSGLSTEDSHRAACQQWVSGGHRVAFHDVRTQHGREQWTVSTVDVATGEQRVLARDRQLGWGQPGGDLVPVYGPHWDPAAHRDLDLIDVTTGECRTVLTAEAVCDAYPDLIREEFGELGSRQDWPLSIFFPALSPDLTRVFFKMAAPLGGHYRSKEASRRAMLVCYDLAAQRFLFADQKWGHPAWSPDSRTILDVPHVLIDADTGARRTLGDLPRLPGSHPSFSPDGSLYVSDVALHRIEDGPLKGGKGEWGIVVVDIASQQLALIDRFDDSEGTSSWRRCHPHPVFSADGDRIYYAVSRTPWTQLHVAQAGLPAI